MLDALLIELKKNSSGISFHSEKDEQKLKQLVQLLKSSKMGISNTIVRYKLYTNRSCELTKSYFVLV